MENYNYTGKTVFVGIDVHKKTYVCVSICEDEMVKKDTMPADPPKLIQYLRNQFSGATLKTVYEAGFSGFHLHRELVNSGIDNIVVHPGPIEVAARDRVKTDRRDAAKMAIQLAAGRLNCIYIPTLEKEAKRSASRLRDSLVKMRTQVGQKIKSLLFTQGLISAGDNTIIGKRWLTEKLKEIKKSNYPQGFYYSLDQYSKQWLALTENLTGLKKDLLAMQTKEEKELIKIYQSAPGIGEITALKLKDELGDMQQFPNEKKLFSYLGLTPTEYSSGQHVRQGHISRQGRSLLRGMLIESSWSAIRKDPQLKAIYQRISKHRGAKRAIVGVARRLAGRLRSCARQRTLYELKN